MSVDPDAEVCAEGKRGCRDPHLTDAQKAAVLDDFVVAFAEEYWEIGGGWALFVGSTRMPEGSSDLLAKMLDANREQ